MAGKFALIDPDTPSEFYTKDSWNGQGEMELGKCLLTPTHVTHQPTFFQSSRTSSIKMAGRSTQATTHIGKRLTSTIGWVES
jgi:hypothetical protein